jgi:hypothetical protein
LVAHTVVVLRGDDSQRKIDQWATAATVVLFWPAAFLVKGDGNNAAELARLKGVFEAFAKLER